MDKGKLILDFVCSDESVNRYGYWIRTEGIRTDAYMSNPVFLLQHSNDNLGKVTELTKTNGQMTCQVEFDADDPAAVRIYNKYKNGYMNAVSIALGNITTTNAEEYLKAGQTYATVYESELLEISAVNVPGNRNAVKLYGDDGKELQLSFINTETMEKKDNTVKDMNALIVKSEAEKTAESAKAVQQTASEKEAELQKKIATLEAEKTELAKQKAKDLIELHVKRGVVTETERVFFERNANEDYDTTKKVLEARKGNERVDRFVNGMQTEPNGSPDKQSFDYLQKKAPEKLIQLRAENPDAYVKLAKEYLASKQGNV